MVENRKVCRNFFKTFGVNNYDKDFPVVTDTLQKENFERLRKAILRFFSYMSKEQSPSPYVKSKKLLHHQRDSWFIKATITKMMMSRKTNTLQNKYYLDCHGDVSFGPFLLDRREMQLSPRDRY